MLYMDYKAVIFDLDGTLLDSMGIWDEIDRIFFKKRNLQKHKDYSKNVQGLTLENIAKYIVETYKLEESVTEIAKEIEDLAYEQYKNNIKLKKGAYEYLVYLMENGIKIGIATACEKRLYEVCLKENKIYDFFNVIVDIKCVEKGKEFPDIYLLCAKELGVEPKDCIVFEDILKAIYGVKKAGMKAYIIYEEYSKNDKEEIFKECDEYITDFREMIYK